MKSYLRPELQTDLPLAAAEDGAVEVRLSWWRRAFGSSRRVGSIAAVVFALFLVWHVVTGRNGLNSWQQKSAEEKALHAEIQRLTEENSILSEHVDRLKSNPAAIEDEARRRLHYARPNEVLYELPPSAQAPGTDSSH